MMYYAILHLIIFIINATLEPGVLVKKLPNYPKRGVKAIWKSEKAM